MADDFSDEQWDQLTDALVQVFGADKLDIDEERAAFRRDDVTYLVVHRDRRVEGGMPLHQTVLGDVEGMSVDRDAITFHAPGGVYTYRRPY